MKSVILSLIFAISLSGCAALRSVSLTPIPSDRKSQVKAESSKVIFLGLTFDNDYVNEMVSDLQRQCPSGKVTGILTKDEAINYFLFIVYKRKVTATGYCVASGNAANTKSRGRGTASEDSGAESGEL